MLNECLTNFGGLVLGVAWRGYRIYLQKLKVPEEVSSKPKEKERGEKYF